jgi:CHASE1-domain containing sensor protein
MHDSASRVDDLIQEQKQLEQSGRLHRFHWLIIGGSLLVTLGAWAYAERQSQQKTEEHFNRQSTQAVALISERMLKYEDALWGGALRR